ncbi:MAG: M20/M25/M40 family metallo-hydrolase [Candidatus Methylomirabilales bacterium]
MSQSRSPGLWALCAVPLLLLTGATATPREEGITPEALRAEVRLLASPQMEGRGVGTKGIDRAAYHIAQAFQRAGLEPAGDQGTYRQTFPVVTGVHLGTGNALTTSGPQEPTKPYQPGTDFTPFGFSENGRITAEVVFAGYGITAPELRYDDYAGLEVSGKIALVMTHEPREEDEQSPFRDPQAYRYTEVRYKAINAREHGAKAIIIVTDPLNHKGESETLFALKGVAAGARAGILAVNATRTLAGTILARTGTSLGKLQGKIDRTLTPASFVVPGLRMAVSVDLIEERGKTANVVGLLPGTDPRLRETAVVIGAHYDHLGFGGEYSLAPSKVGRIHPGADDNASGVAAVMGLARAFARVRSNKRTLIFAAFSGEEMGILGSSHYVKHPPIPLERTVAMINLDMVGRLTNKTLYILGVKTGKEFADLLQEANRGLSLRLQLSGDGYGPSDHTSFYTRKIPVLMFFTGPHTDYHRPSDTVAKINPDGLAQVTRLVYRVVERLASESKLVTYVRVDTPPPARGGRGYGAYFGSIPDFTPNEGIGVRLSGVRPGSPAEKTGLREGDVIVKMAGVRIKNLHDLVFVLRSKRAGDQVEVVFLRGNQKIKGITTLEQRR